MKVTLLSKEEKQEYMDMQACYEAIKSARLIRRKLVDRGGGEDILMSMWEVLQPVIESEG